MEGQCLQQYSDCQQPQQQFNSYPIEGGENTGQGLSSSWNYRPHGALARALYEKQLSDERIDSMDKNQWYECDLNHIPLELSQKFIKLSFDSDTDFFLKQSVEKSDWVWTQLWHSLAKSFLSWFMTQTNINGLLGRGSMFVLSFSQFLQLLKVPQGQTWGRFTLLDLGAGDGEVTAKIAPAFETVFVTEMSHTMRGILQRRGYQVLDINNWANKTYDVISCLNLLDRCDSPISLLQQIKGALKPDGILIVALVLPFSQYVETGRSDHKPVEALPISGKTFEQQVASVVRTVFQPAGYEVYSWTRVPYLCEGDLKQCYYWLDDSVFVLKPIGDIDVESI